MNPGFQTEPPDVPAAASLREGDAGSLRDGGVVEETRFCHRPPGPVRARRLSLHATRVRGGALGGSELPGLRLTDTALEEADLAAATWIDVRMTRVLLTECRLTGFDGRGAEMRDVRFLGCRAPDMILGEASFSRVRFEDCRVAGLDLSGARIESLALRGCDARNLRLVGARIGMLDLRSSLIDGIAIEPGGVRGLVIDPPQGPSLARALGARVLDPE